MSDPFDNAEDGSYRTPAPPMRVSNLSAPWSGELGTMSKDSLTEPMRPQTPKRPDLSPEELALIIQSPLNDNERTVYQDFDEPSAPEVNHHGHEIGGEMTIIETAELGHSSGADRAVGSKRKSAPTTAQYDQQLDEQVVKQLIDELDLFKSVPPTALGAAEETMVESKRSTRRASDMKEPSFSVPKSPFPATSELSTNRIKEIIAGLDDYKSQPAQMARRPSNAIESTPITTTSQNVDSAIMDEILSGLDEYKSTSTQFRQSYVAPKGGSSLSTVEESPRPPSEVVGEAISEAKLIRTDVHSSPKRLSRDSRQSSAPPVAQARKSRPPSHNASNKRQPSVVSEDGESNMIIAMYSAESEMRAPNTKVTNDLPGEMTTIEKTRNMMKSALQSFLFDETNNTSIYAKPKVVYVEQQDNDVEKAVIVSDNDAEEMLRKESDFEYYSYGSADDSNALFSPKPPGGKNVAAHNPTLRNRDGYTKRGLKLDLTDAKEHATSIPASKKAATLRKPPPGFNPAVFKADDVDTPLQSPGISREKAPRDKDRTDPNGTKKPKKKVPKALKDPAVRKQLKKLKRHKPRFTVLITIINVVVMLYALVANYARTDAVIALEPMNIMIGPDARTLISIGARYTPCMKPTKYLNGTFQCIPSPGTNSTRIFKDPSSGMTYTPCKLQEFCGMSSFSSGTNPDQWYRLVMPIFLHGGVVHLLLNSIMMWRTGKVMEEAYGTWRIAVVYFFSGIGGFLFGGNLTENMPTVGASGAIYGIMAVVLLDLLLNFKIVPNRWKELGRMLFMIIASLAFGLLPLIDNFAHVGGFLVGLLCGLFVLPAINFGKWDKRVKVFVRLASGPMLFAVMIWLFVGFYSSDPNATCTWCKYLDCVPINGWCDGY